MQQRLLGLGETGVIQREESLGDFRLYKGLSMAKEAHLQQILTGG